MEQVTNIISGSSGAVKDAPVRPVSESHPVKDPQAGRQPVSENKPVEVDFEKLTESVNKFVRSVGTKLSFTFDDRTSQPVILVKDRESGDVIRQIPPEEMLALAEKLEDIAGIIFNRNV